MKSLKLVDRKQILNKRLIKTIAFLFVAILFLASFATYFAAARAREIMQTVMRRDAESLAAMFIEGTSSVYNSQVTVINDLRAKLMIYCSRVETIHDLNKIPEDFAFSIIIDKNYHIVAQSGLPSSEFSDWLSQIEEIVKPIILEKTERYFIGLNPELPTSTGPVGYVKRLDDKILIVMVPPPFSREAGIGLYARQLAQKASVRYLILQNENGVILASKDVSKVEALETDTFLSHVYNDETIATRFTEFDGEKVFELAHPFPRLGRLEGILRIGFTLSEFKELSAIVNVIVVFGVLMASLAAAALLALWSSMKRAERFREEHSRLLHLKSLGEIAASVAHEIRNPLNAINISIQRLKFEFVPQNDAEEFLAISNSAAQEIARIDAIVREFIAVTGNFSPVATSANVLAFLNKIIGSFSTAFENKQAKVTVECDENLRFEADFGKLERAIGNLVKNALDEMPENADLKISCIDQKNKLTFKIYNSGTQIPAHLIDKLFEPFVSGKVKGTGIGLFYAFRIIEAHGGTIAAKNLVDGVEFEIVLPKVFIGTKT